MKTFLEIISEENNRVVTKPSYRQLSTTIQEGENFKMNVLEKVKILIISLQITHMDRVMNGLSTA
jgi:hypothetical protein